MKREIIDRLCQWKASKYRKPLLLRGARQVGKTWALKEFGKTFHDGFLLVDFDRQAEYREFFEQTKDVRRILSNLSMASGRKITPETLIVFDEIQSCGDALNSLKYFCEEAPEFAVVGAGSLLGLKLASGFPVGKVEFMDMGPMNFSEFLQASGAGNLLDYMRSVDRIENVPEAFANPLLERLKSFFVVGGMPEAVRFWAEEGDVAAADKVLSDILDSYESDFAKHAARSDVPKIQYIWDSLPSQLSRENKKFLYSAVRPGARAREYETALNWLVNADLAKKVFRSAKPGLPLSAYDDLTSFKIYMGDVGLLRKKARLAPSAFADGNRLFVEFKGALAENFALQSLSANRDVPLRYWHDGACEVDFLLQRENAVLPVEVKAGTNVHAASLKRYGRECGAEVLVRLSLRNLSFDGRILNVPLFMIDELDRLLELVP